MIKTNKAKVIGEVIGGQTLIRKVCTTCGKTRKFLKGTARDKTDKCGECWNWELFP